MGLTDAVLADFRSGHRGTVIDPTDVRYDQARRVWNAMIDKRPALIARPRDQADVVACVRFAQRIACRCPIRGGAHGIAGRATCDEGLVVDFARHEGDRRRSRGANRTGAAGPDVAGVRPRNSGVRPGDHRRHDRGHRHRRADAGRRVRLARRAVRHDGGQSARRRHRPGRRPRGARQRQRPRRSVLGPARRRRQLRRRDLVRHTACTRSARRLSAAWSCTRSPVRPRCSVSTATSCAMRPTSWSRRRC